MHELASKHRRAGPYSHKNTHMQPRAYIHKHIYGVIPRSGALPLAQTRTHAHTHTLSEEARWNHSVGCWPFTLWRLDFSLFLLLHRPFFLPFLFPLTPFLLIFVNASSPRFHLFSFLFHLTFLFVLRLQVFSFCKQHTTKVDCVEQIVQFTMRRAFSEDSF